MKNESIMFRFLRRFVCYYVVQRNVYSTFVSYWRSYHRDVFARLKRGSGMREILFRAKGQTSDRWYEGLLTRLDQDVCRIKDNRHKVWICDPETVCQYTGLTDRNGRKIFEGDIILHETAGKIKVQFEKSEFIVVGIDRTMFRAWLSSIHGNFKIIGNIFDNPDLCE